MTARPFTVISRETTIRDWADTRPDQFAPAETIQHDDESDEVACLAAITAGSLVIGIIIGVIIGALGTVMLALIINYLPSARAIAASDRNAPRSAQHIATVDAGSDKGIPS